MARYDTIGQGYQKIRQEDPRIADRILQALGSAAGVVNVGAGAGSYEPVGRTVVAVEPSIVMIRQRTGNAAPAVQASATHLPFADESFDAALGVLTIHHWPDLALGLQELRRVARKKVVILTYDTSAGGFWLMDYFPEIPELDRQRMPAIADLEPHLGPLTVYDVPVPHDCRDGFLGAYWRRPEAYLRAEVRAAISLFADMKRTDAGVAALQADLDSGVWQQRYGHLLDRTELDVGYRLVVASLGNR